MDEKKWKDKIRDSAENAEIPDSLKPEEIEKKLRKRQPERWKFPFKWASVTAATLLVTVVAVWQLNNSIETGVMELRQGGRSAVTERQSEEEPAVVEMEQEPEAGGLESADQAADMTAAEASAADTQSAAEAQSDQEAAAEAPAAEAAPEASQADSAPDKEASEAETQAAAVENAPFSPAGSYEELYEILSENAVSSNDMTARTGALADGAVMESAQEIAGEDSVAAADTGAAGDYSETNLQEQGVDEGDIVKTDGSCIYVLNQSGKIEIVRASGTAMTEAATVDLQKDSAAQYYSEMYVDGDTLVVIGTAYETQMKEDSDASTYWIDENVRTSAITYDISDPENPRLLGSVQVDGFYLTSRKNGDYLYLITEYAPVLAQAREDSDYVPMAGQTQIAASDIYVPESCQDTNYLVIASVNLNEPETIVDSKAFVSAVGHYYVSTENIYLSVVRWLDGGGSRTDIMKFSYDEGKITGKAAGSVNGYVNSSFSMNEWNGYLRMVVEQYNDTYSNALYILDETMEICGSITDIAQGETLQSVRLLEDTGYFVTYKNVDPLFSVDLSDPENPRILGELKVTGFSSYLHFYGEDRLLGIGSETDPDTGASKGIKLSMFDISNPANVTEIAKYVIEDTYSFTGLYNYKAVLADPEKNLIGFSADDSYLVFSFGEEGFTNLLTCSLRTNPNIYTDADGIRGLYIGETFYLADEDKVTSYDMTKDFARTQSLVF